jgi:hypothetical protein
MTAEFRPWRYRKWIQRAFYVAVALGVAAVVIGGYMK